MEIISHRGIWHLEHEKNHQVAFSRAFESGFGVETDLRDYSGEVVISHDLPNSNCMTLESFFDLYKNETENIPNKPTLALNIKSDGLHNMIYSTLKKYAIENYFVFDMSVPDSRLYIDIGINTFTRQSEYETAPSFYSETSGVWLDCFEGRWFSNEIIEKHKKAEKKICIVSPELHNRNDFESEQWYYLKHFCDHSKLMICTDLPNQAEEYFNARN